MVLAHLLLGHNPFKAETPEDSRQRIMTMPIPNFCELDARINPRLNEIMAKALARDRNQRYADCDQFLYDLEHFIYSGGYGPTNETLGKYVRELFGQVPTLVPSDRRGDTMLLEQSSRFLKPKA